MRGSANEHKAARIIAVAMLLTAGVGGAAWIAGTLTGSVNAGAAAAARNARSAELASGSFVPARQDGASPAEGTPLPSSLSGTMAPRLPLDDGGHLARARTVRDFFDYFLAAEHEVSADALERLVRREIAAQLDGTPAQAEALEAWRRYSTYRDALARIAVFQAPRSAAEDAPNGAPVDLDAMQSALDERASVAKRAMGAEWGEAFFGSEWRRARYDIARWRVLADSTLTDGQKAARLHAFAEMLPPGERAALEREGPLQASVAAIAEWQRQGLPPDQLWEAASQALGTEAAQRVMRMQQDDDAWRAKYERYAIERAQIDAMGLATRDRDAQVAELRERSFATSGERLRAASLDRGAGGQR